MIKGLYQIPPCTQMKVLNSNIWWLEGVELLDKGLAYHKGINLYCKEMRCVEIYGIVIDKISTHGNKCKENLGSRIWTRLIG